MAKKLLVRGQSVGAAVVVSVEKDEEVRFAGKMATFL
jgi:hypothetical protein